MRGIQCNKQGSMLLPADKLGEWDDHSSRVVGCNIPALIFACKHAELMLHLSVSQDAGRNSNKTDAPHHRLTRISCSLCTSCSGDQSQPDGGLINCTHDVNRGTCHVTATQTRVELARNQCRANRLVDQGYMTLLGEEARGRAVDRQGYNSPLESDHAYHTHILKSKGKERVNIVSSSTPSPACTHNRSSSDLIVTFRQ
jgi:hypothetical protein